MTPDNVHPSSRVVRVEVRIPGDAVPVAASRVVAQVEDYSRADAPSPVIGETVRSDVVFEADGRERFRIEIPPGAIDERNMYSVRVHVDVDGSGSIDTGDLITMRSYPVLTRGHPDEVEVEVRPV